MDEGQPLTAVFKAALTLAETIGFTAAVTLLRMVLLIAGFTAGRVLGFELVASALIVVPFEISDFF